MPYGVISIYWNSLNTNTGDLKMKFFLIQLANSSSVSIDLLIDSPEALAFFNKEHASKDWDDAIESCLKYINENF